MVAYSFKPRFVAPIRAGLGHLPEFGVPPYPKRQTIRAVGRRRHARSDERLQLYCGMRTRQCFLIGVATCLQVRPITLLFRGDELFIRFEGALRNAAWNERFAQRDGFAGLAEMAAFWKAAHAPLPDEWEGLLIEWGRRKEDDNGAIVAANWLAGDEAAR